MDVLTLFSNVQPLIILAMLVIMYSIENVSPYLPKPANRKKHDLRNYLLSFINLVINGGLAFGVVAAVTYADQHHMGLLRYIPLSTAPAVILGILLIDLGSYTLHIMQHKVPMFWSFHRVHHSDPNLTSSSSLRFHPFDTILSQGIWQAIWFPLMGIPLASIIIYGTFFLPLFIMQHSNVKLPDAVEKYGRYIFSTPGWHKIHHAADQKYTDSHYGDFFTFWDRIFGTWTPVDPKNIEYGLHEFNTDTQHTTGYLLGVPFKHLKRK